MNRPNICDYCGETSPRHHIELTRKLNGDDLVIELCSHCLTDVIKYLEEVSHDSE